MTNVSVHRVLLTRDIPMSDLPSLETIFIDRYLAKNGYKAATKALQEMKPADIIEEVKKSGLRGRGGGGFPTGEKWEMVAGAAGEEKHVCCNAAEGEQGTFKDRCLIRSSPHQVIEGIIIASYAVGAHVSYLYVNENYREEIRVFEKALEEAQEKGYIGKKIFGTDFSLDIHIQECPDQYVAGEETAMIEVIEGRAAKPWQKPPYYPANRGIYGNPTLVNNTGTLSNIPHIVRNGGDWFSKIGAQQNPGTMLFSLTGDVNRPGVYELPLGTPLSKLISHCGDGLKDGRRFKAAFLPGNAPVTESHLEVCLDVESLKEAGSGLGCAAVTVLGDGTCVVATTLKFSRFFMDESCGQCPSCQMGTTNMTRLLQKIEDGHGEAEDLAAIENICSLSKGEGYCHLLSGAVFVVEGAVRHFRKEFEAHIHEKRCPLQTSPAKSL